MAESQLVFFDVKSFNVLDNGVASLTIKRTGGTSPITLSVTPFISQASTVVSASKQRLSFGLSDTVQYTFQIQKIEQLQSSKVISFHITDAKFDVHPPDNSTVSIDPQRYICYAYIIPNYQATPGGSLGSPSSSTASSFVDALTKALNLIPWLKLNFKETFLQDPLWGSDLANFPLIEISDYGVDLPGNTLKTIIGIKTFNRYRGSTDPTDPTGAGCSIDFGHYPIQLIWSEDVNNSYLGRFAIRTRRYDNTQPIGFQVWDNGGVSIGVGDILSDNSALGKNQTVEPDSLVVAGYVKGAGISTAIKSVSSNYTILPTDSTIIATSPLSLTLPSLSPLQIGRIYSIRNASSGAVSLVGSIDFNSVSAGGGSTIQWDGSRWWTISRF